MLTADHVEGRIKDGELVLRKMDRRALVEAEALATAYLTDAAAAVGRTRDELEEAWQAHEVGARVRLAAGLRKLIEDRSTFDEAGGVDPVTLRRDLFERAATQRKASGALDRPAAIAASASRFGVEPAEVERMLFADRRGEHVLVRAPAVSGKTILDAYLVGRLQAVLLKAARVTCDVRSTSPALVRAFFAKLKFHQLLFTIERRDTQTLRLVIDGPFSMFDSVTRYGLQLASIVPALRELDAWTIEADVRWSRQKIPVVFRDAGGGPAQTSGANHVPEETLRIIAAIHAAKRGWHAATATEVLATADGKVVVPDLLLEKDGKKVYVELLGFWSRDAVWRRVEMAEKGLGASIVFCANARLRVSEELLGEDAHAALYVYKSKIVGPALLDRVERVAYAPAPCTSSSPELRAESEKPSRAST